MNDESLLPEEILQRATLRGSEYAWPVDAIPDVIEAARQKGLLNLGGQLQLSLSDGSTGEAYWVEVDVPDAPPGLDWKAKVVWAADEALARFQLLRDQYDFEGELRNSFPEAWVSALSGGGDPREAICFVWYVDAPVSQS